ncbi:MAG: hypothetical protein WDW38_007596 [Sanguina aurantia]
MLEATTETASTTDQPKARAVRSGSMQPTNYDMLVWRTLNRALRVPGANEDNLAERLRNELMPVRSWCMQYVPGFNYRMKGQLGRTMPGAVNYVDSRTTWLDTRVVVIAAGFDTRAYRLHAPGVQFYEIDLPQASTKKQQLVTKLKLLPQEAHPPSYAGADLSVESLSDVLSRTAFDPARPALFTVEGLLYYIPLSAVESLFRSISSIAAPGSRVCFDFLDSDVLEGKAEGAGFETAVKVVQSKDEPFVSGLKASAEGIAAFSESVGLKLQRFVSAQELAKAAFGAQVWTNACLPTISFMAGAELCKA